ncbi:TonB family protein [Roseibacterium beibuensis]|uniref:TonB family protein n=1 Tax=[Roseibacterium] beibuensis TaxID=1193142 RepID=A0ABP9L2F9_9RHOB|nr:TonB family protein [Roseibacterium beibuensis]MCS6621691.1 TonB family protein [Roseibacterium beibuensis]
MRRRAPFAVGVAALLSVTLHGTGIVALGGEERETLSGGPPQIAMIGNSFEDAVAGVATPVPPSEVTETPDRIDPTEAARPDRIAPSEAEPVAQATVAETRPTDPPTIPSPMMAEVTPTPPSALAPTVPVAATPVTPSPAQPATRPQPERVEAQPDPVVRRPEADTPRPTPRVARPAPQPSQPAPQGSAATTTRAGEAAGQQTGAGAQTAAGDTGSSASDGRAAARYPNLVNRQLTRLRRPNTRFSGAAVIAFTIAPSGGLAAISVARSSGNAEFDRIALSHVQRAAPFPPPPPGAQRSYSVAVRGR